VLSHVLFFTFLNGSKAKMVQIDTHAHFHGDVVKSKTVGRGGHHFHLSPKGLT
jgi:hypothetical protein